MLDLSDSAGPEQTARECRRRIGAEQQPEIDLSELADDLGIIVRRGPLRGPLGAALLVDGQPAVVLAEDQNPLRSRFTQAHELGHLTIPRHRRLLRRKKGLVDEDIQEGNPENRTEAEANDFAAELLAPQGLVTSFVTARDTEVGTATALANEFRVSVTSAALRMVEVASTPCAVVQLRAGRIHWFRRPTEFPYGLPDRGAPPPERSVTAHVADGGEPYREAVEIDPKDWLVERDGDFPSKMLESSMNLGNTGLQITILTVPRSR